MRAVYAEANWDRIESWHPDPRSLYAVGPLVDVGIYPLTILTAIFGPVRLVRAFATTLQTDRVLLDGTSFTPGGSGLRRRRARARGRCRLTPDGELLRRPVQAERDRGARRRGLALHADVAEANSRLEHQQRGGEYATIPPVREPFPGNDWGRALVDLARAIDEGRPHRAGAEHAAHVVEVLNAVEESAGAGGAVAVHSAFPPPEPMDWAR